MEKGNKKIVPFHVYRKRNLQRVGVAIILYCQPKSFLSNSSKNDCFLTYYDFRDGKSILIKCNNCMIIPAWLCATEISDRKYYG